VSVFLLAVLNGLSKFKKVIWVNILGNIIALIVSLVMIFQFRTLGALLAIVISPSLLFFVTLYSVQKEISFYRQSDLVYLILKLSKNYYHTL